MSGRFIDVYVFNSQFGVAKNAIVSSLLTLLDVSPKKLSLDRKNSFRLFLKKKPIF